MQFVGAVPRHHLPAVLAALALPLLPACADDDVGPIDPIGEPVTGDIAPPESIVAPPVATPDWMPPAPPIAGEIRYLPGRDSALIYLPVVPGVQDYRVYALDPRVTVEDVDGGTEVGGATLFCAGLRQHNLCDDSEAYDFGPQFKVDHCDADGSTSDVPKEVLRVVQLDGLTEASDIVVEAVDALCPFPGAEGVRHRDLTCWFDGAQTAPAIVDGNAVIWPHCPQTFPIRTEAEIRAQYGSLIVNGHGPVPIAPGTSPTASIGLPAPARNPVVLGRAVVRLTPTGTATPPPGYAFWDDFDDDADQPRRVIDDGNGILVPAGYAVAGPDLSQTSKVNIYNHSSDDSQAFVARGTLRSLFADGGQDIMGSNLIVPRQAFAMPPDDDGYLHVTFEVPTDATLRRYWVFVACGAETAGNTIGTGPGFAADGALATESAMIFTPGFMDDNGAALSTAGWNCLQLVPRRGSYYPVEGGPYPRAETDLRVVINRALPGYDAVDDLPTARPVHIPSPDLADGNKTWYRTWDADHQPNGVLLDDEMYIEQRTRLDVFFNRGRVVVYANGAQKLCNDFPDARLTMGDAAVGIGHVLYHSSAEKGDLNRTDWLATAQYQYRKNLPFIDQRGFDNFGVQPDAALPASFDARTCYDGGAP